MTEIEERIEGIIKDKLEQGISIGGNTVQITSDTVLFPSGSNSNHMKIYKDYIQYPDGSHQTSAIPSLTVPIWQSGTATEIANTWQESNINDGDLTTEVTWQNNNSSLKVTFDKNYRVNYFRHGDSYADYEDDVEWKIYYDDAGSWTQCASGSYQDYDLNGWSNWINFGALATSGIRIQLTGHSDPFAAKSYEWEFKYSGQ